MLDAAFDALKKMDWGTSLAELNPIEDAITAAKGKGDANQEMEQRLAAALKEPLSLDAREYVCRKLAMIGTAASVPALAPLLVDKEISHMSRFALERIPGPQAGQALIDALSKVSGNLKIGVISSLGARGDSAAVAALGGSLREGDPAVTRSAAMALGAIGSAEAASMLQSVLHSSGVNPQAIADGLLSCAESLLSNGKTADANAIYKSFAQENQPRIVRLAAMRGLLACAGKQA